MREDNVIGAFGRRFAILAFGIATLFLIPLSAGAYSCSDCNQCGCASGASWVPTNCWTVNDGCGWHDANCRTESYSCDECDHTCERYVCDSVYSCSGSHEECNYALQCSNPPPSASGVGNLCNPNNCGQYGGTIQCGGGCSGGTPSNPYPIGDSCNQNSCGQYGGTYNCNGCSGGVPPNPEPNSGPCGNCGTWSCGSCINQGSCASGNTQCSGSRYQTCINCGWQNSGGINADGDGTDSQCGDSLCDNNPSYVDANRQCSVGQTQCAAGRYQGCGNCAWSNVGANADGDSLDSQCGDSQCDNSAGVYDSTKTTTESACTDGLDNDCDGTTDCSDSDCGGRISGMVRDSSNAIAYATVSAYAKATLAGFANTNSQGQYSITGLCGTFNVVAQQKDYASKTKSGIAVAPMQQVIVDFIGSASLVLATTCEADCTQAGDILIHASCNGINGCSFFNAQAAQACNFARVGWIRDYNATHEVECPSGSPQKKVYIAASVTCSKKTLVKTSAIVLYRGKPVKMVVASCG